MKTELLKKLKLRGTHAEGVFKNFYHIELSNGTLMTMLAACWMLYALREEDMLLALK